jgi:hypothetical protein
MAAIDTLKLARELRERGGFTQEAAEATAEALNTALGERMASKADLDQAVERLEHRTDQLGSDLRADMNRLRAEILKWMFGQVFFILAGGAALIHFFK